MEEGGCEVGLQLQFIPFQLLKHYRYSTQVKCTSRGVLNEVVAGARGILHQINYTSTSLELLTIKVHPWSRRDQKFKTTHFQAKVIGCNFVPNLVTVISQKNRKTLMQEHKWPSSYHVHYFGKKIQKAASLLAH